MTSDYDNDRNKKSQQGKQLLSDETIERIKRTILFGEDIPPPQRTRSKKERSDNTKGRPKATELDFDSDRSANAIALREGERPISVREGGEIRQMPAIDAVAKKQIAIALAGNAYAQKHAMQRHDLAEREARGRRLRNIEFWTAYIEVHREAIRQAKERKETPPSPLPHPDDIVIDYEKGVRFKGPVNEEELTRFQETIKLRDLLILQDALDQREAGEPETGDPDDRPGTAMLFAMVLNQYMPERFKLSEAELFFKIARHNGTPKRVLLKELYSAWREAGAPRPRGYTFPSLRVGKKVVGLIGDLLAKLKQGGDLSEITEPMVSKAR